MNKLWRMASIVLAMLLTASIGFSAQRGSFGASLSGSDAVPRVKTTARGEAVFKLAKNGTELTYKLTVSGIENVTAAHIHLGKQGKSGPPVVGLFAGPTKTGKFSGVLAQGVITRKELLGSLSGKPVASLVKLIRSGDTYVNVHTDAHPEGEIRGQIR